MGMTRIRVETIPQDVLRELVRRVLNPGPVEFDPRDGVTCPVCQAKLTSDRTGPGLGVTCTKPWQGSARERYHTCPVCGDRFKSIETGRAA